MIPPTPDLVISALEQVLASPLFARAGRQSRFLRHIVERKLAGDDAALRETVIGLEVYERPGSYDPKEDPIVRVEAARLRGRLREYYETADESQRVEIRLPKGSYVPVFDWRGQGRKPADAPAVLVEEVHAPPAEPKKTPVRWWIPAILGLAIASAAGLFWFRRQPEVKPIESIAVMPFADLSEKKDLSYLASGLAEQIEEELATIRNLRVVGDTTVKQEAGNPDLRTAARRMGASALLEGSLREDERKVRVTVRLYDGETGNAIWSSSFDGDRTSLFEFEEKIAQSLAAKLNLHLAARREGIDARKNPKRAQSYEYLVEAQTAIHRESAGSIALPYSLLQQAVATDPSYAAAHAALAGILIRSGGALGGPDGKALALQHVRRALELDPSLPSAHAAEIVYYRDIGNDRKRARDLCGSATRDYPNAATILDACATIEGDSLSFAEQVTLARRATLLDPLASRPHGGLMLALYQAGQFEEALTEADTAQKMDPANYFVRRHRALILAARGLFPEALKVLDEARVELGGDPENWMTVRGYVLGKMGNRTAALELITDYVQKGASNLNLGIVYLGMGDRSKALDLFESAAQKDPSQVTHAIAEYYCRSLDGDPRFEALKKKLGIIANVTASRSN